MHHNKRQKAVAYMPIQLRIVLKGGVITQFKFEITAYPKMSCFI